MSERGFNQMVSTLIDDDETEYVKVPKAVANKMRDDAVCYRELWLYSRNQTARLKEYYDRMVAATGWDWDEHTIGADGPHPITIKYASDDLGIPDRVIDNNLHRKRARE